MAAPLVVAEADMRMSTIAILLCLVCLGGLACPDRRRDEAAAPPVAARSRPGPTASKLVLPPASASVDDIRSALESSGWSVVSLSTSGGISNIIATSEDVQARVVFYNPVSEAHRRYLERDEGAAMHLEGNVLLGVVIEGDRPAAQSLLDSLLGQ